MVDILSYLELIVGLTVGFLWVIVGICKYFISKIQSTEFLVSSIDHLKKVMYGDPREYVILANQALEHYRNISRKSFCSKKILKNSELFKVLIQQISDSILILDTDNECEVSIIVFSKKAQDVKKELSEIVWPNTSKKMDHISRTLDKTAEIMAVLWEKKTNDYVY